MVLGIGLCCILAFNHFYYGGILLINYSPENGWYTFPAFSLAYAVEPPRYNLLVVFKTMWSNFSLLLLLAPIGVFIMSKRYRLLFIFSVVSSVLLYSIYRFSARGINARFLLPIYPFLAILCAEAILFVVKKAPWSGFKTVSLAVMIVLLGWRIPGQIDQLILRNSDSANLTAAVQDWIQETPNEAVFLSYVLNDQIAIYGKRSVLNYRRIPQYEPATDKYHYDMLELCLVYAVDSLLLGDIPVYYIEDGTPPLYDSKAVLERHYELISFRESPKIFAIHSDPLTEPRETKGSCSP